MPKTVTSTVKYKVPSWSYCNNQSPLAPHKTDGTRCRFCDHIKGDHHMCSLYNEPLETWDGFIKKLPKCIRHTAGFKDVPIELDLLPSGADAAKSVLREYRRMYLALIKAGYPDKVAHDVTMGGLFK